MKRNTLAALPLALAMAGAHAQSTVTLYGVIDVGIDYANNVVSGSNGNVVPGSGGKLTQMQSGVPLGSRWGLLGTEDLGGGNQAIFRLESGFDAATGGLGGGLAFSRNAYVGIKSNQYGQLTFGKQWDASVDIVEPFTLNGQYGGWYFAHPNDMDNLDNGFPINNSVKYVSPNLVGFTFEGHYSFGGVAGQFSNNSSYSAAAGYSHGTFSAGVSYLRINDPITAVAGYGSGGGYVNTIYGDALANARYQGALSAGAAYVLGSLKVGADYSNVDFAAGPGGHDLHFQNYEVSGIYSVNSALIIGAGYTFTTGLEHATDTSPKYHQVNLIAQYSLSKRTSVYVMGIYQHAAGAAQYAQITSFNPSSTQNQVVTRVGITHSF
ncbi:Outer membrane protein (porin) [Paraburkholderia phenazinium]|uniref:Outer membrane protein (Porin) n=2 Tax=Burkholderiaceae TaxID=119060 RepID=A0A1N6JE98_9BURK|nr:porin [Paraburkholderia phenazinium]SIO42489.1 Outer membrane protein (porin) [Paraburkholderia phenazinium]